MFLPPTAALIVRVPEETHPDNEVVLAQLGLHGLETLVHQLTDIGGR